MKKLDVKLMHPVEQINMVIGRIYEKGMTENHYKFSFLFLNEAKNLRNYYSNHSTFKNNI